jgi:hypothetical protein
MSSVFVIDTLLRRKEHILSYHLQECLQVVNYTPRRCVIVAGSMNARMRSQPVRGSTRTEVKPI